MRETATETIIKGLKRVGKFIIEALEAHGRMISPFKPEEDTKQKASADQQ